ncbi:MAG: hypothetical protein QXD09_02040 [Candidatus Caldarchaeum sp.]
MCKPLFYLEAKDGREVRIAIWVEDGTPHFSYGASVYSFRPSATI